MNVAIFNGSISLWVGEFAIRSDFGPSPTRTPGFGFRAEVALTVDSTDNGHVVIALARHMVDPLACNADIALDIARHADPANHRFAALDQMNRAVPCVAIACNKARSRGST